MNNIIDAYGLAGVTSGKPLDCGRVGNASLSVPLLSIEKAEGWVSECKRRLVPAARAMDHARRIAALAKAAYNRDPENQEVYAKAESMERASEDCEAFYHAAVIEMLAAYFELAGVPVAVQSLTRAHAILTFESVYHLMDPTGATLLLQVLVTADVAKKARELKG